MIAHITVGQNSSRPDTGDDLLEAPGNLIQRLIPTHSDKSRLGPAFGAHPFERIEHAIRTV